MVEPIREKYQHLKPEKDVKYMQLYWDTHHVAEPIGCALPVAPGAGKSDFVSSIGRYHLTLF